MRHLIPLALTLVAAACAPRGDVPDVVVTQATLMDLDTNTVAVIAGASAGDALLVYYAADGTSGAIPVAVRGGTVGVAFELDLDLNPGSDVPLDLSGVEGDVRLEDLFGTYRGSTWGFTLGLGGAGMRLRNKAGVRLSDAHFTAGAGIYGGFEWLRIRRGGNEGADHEQGEDTGFLPAPPPPSSGGGGGCGGGSATPPPVDTGPDDTDTDTDPGDTDTDPGDTDPGDTDPGDTDPDPDPSDPDPADPSDPDPTPSSSGDGCGCGSSSSSSSSDGCGDGCGSGDDGCSDGSCAVGGGRPPLFALALVIGLLRRRS